MLSLSRDKTYDGIRLRPITYAYGFDKGLGPRQYTMKKLRQAVEMAKRILTKDK